MLRNFPHGTDSANQCDVWGKIGRYGVLSCWSRITRFAVLSADLRSSKSVYGNSRHDHGVPNFRCT